MKEGKQQGIKKLVSVLVICGSLVYVIGGGENQWIIVSGGVAFFYFIYLRIVSPA